MDGLSICHDGDARLIYGWPITEDSSNPALVFNGDELTIACSVRSQVPDKLLRTRPSGLLKFREYCKQASPTVGV